MVPVPATDGSNRSGAPVATRNPVSTATPAVTGINAARAPVAALTNLPAPEVLVGTGRVRVPEPVFAAGAAAGSCAR